MDNINISELSHQELLDLYKTVKEFLEYLEKEKQNEEKQEDTL